MLKQRWSCWVAPMKQCWARWVAGLGGFIATVGMGFAVDRDPPFVRAGDIAVIVGLACLLVGGWVDFGRKRGS